MSYYKFFILGIFSVFLICSNIAHAKKPVLTDSRIKTFVYSENDVFPIVLHYGYQSSIELALNEDVEAISLGDTYSLQVTPVKKRLFLKSLQEDGHTNMTVITTKRTYQFDVTIKNPENLDEIDEDLVYVVRFFYPELNSEPNHLANNNDNIQYSSMNTSIGENNLDKKIISLKETKYNFNYMYHGSESLAPQKVFDDGKSTFILMPKDTPVPSIFIYDEDGKEIPIQLYKKKEYIVIPKVVTQFNIKQDTDIVSVYNQNYENTIR